MASCFSRVGSYDEAIALLRPLYETGDAEPEIYGQLSSLLSEGIGDIQSGLQIAKEAYVKFPEKPGVANNLAYVYLLKGDATSARPILEAHVQTPEEDSNPLNEVCLTATWGLLNILEGNLSEGIRLYKKARKLASQSGSKELENSATQKLHLELARLYLSRQEFRTAKTHVLKGLAIHDGTLIYEQQLQNLQNDLLLLGEGNGS